MHIKSFTIKQLIKTGVHLGHNQKLWHPKMATYLFGVRNNTHIIDLEKTVVMLRRALNIIHKMIADNEGSVLLLGKNFMTNNKWKEKSEVILMLEHNEYNVKWSMKTNNPIIAIVDSNENPTGVTYPIPGNNDSVEAINLYESLIANAVEEALKNAQKKELNYTYKK
jgi:ribosomal protein S2